MTHIHIFCLFCPESWKRDSGHEERLAENIRKSFSSRGTIEVTVTIFYSSASFRKAFQKAAGEGNVPTQIIIDGKMEGSVFKPYKNFQVEQFLQGEQLRTKAPLIIPKLGQLENDIAIYTVLLESAIILSLPFRRMNRRIMSSILTRCQPS